MAHWCQGQTRPDQNLAQIGQTLGLRDADEPAKRRCLRIYPPARWITSMASSSTGVPEPGKPVQEITAWIGKLPILLFLKKWADYRESSSRLCRDSLVVPLLSRTGPAASVQKLFGENLKTMRGFPLGRPRGKYAKSYIPIYEYRRGQKARKTTPQKSAIGPPSASWGSASFGEAGAGW